MGKYNSGDLNQEVSSLANKAKEEERLRLLNDKISQEFLRRLNASSRNDEFNKEFDELFKEN